MNGQATTKQQTSRSGSMHDQLRSILRNVIADDGLHARWLNTLSLLENSGARKISAAQDPALTTEPILRHAFEESRHAWYLKRQIAKLDAEPCPTYEPRYLLAPFATRRYMDRLDVAVSRLVRAELGVSGYELRQRCYLLVTYAIEVKADRLYGIYEEELLAAQSPVSIRGILLEEEAHLAEMTSALEQRFEDTSWWLERCLVSEESIYGGWLAQVSADVGI